MLQLLGFLLLAVASPTGQSSDLLLEGAMVYVSADAAPQRASVLIRSGKIDFVGNAETARRKSPLASRIDLTGSFLFPGFADAHGHLSGLGKSLEIADLRGATSAAEAARRVGAGAAKLPSGAWAEGRGWDQNLWGGRFPDARDLDTVVSERPVVARRVDGHAIWVNSAALRAAGIDRSTPDPSGGRILRRADGSPSGVLVDTANALIEKAMPAPTPTDFERQVLAAMEACTRVGLTEVGDASAYDPEDIALLERLAARRQLPIRVYATVGTGGGSRRSSYEGGRAPASDALTLFFQKGVHIGRGDDFLTVRAIKTYADGALGSRGAALLADYSDEPGNRGWLITPSEQLDALARRAREHGWQLWVHAIGDLGNRVSLDAFERARAAIPKADSGGDRPRIEHAQVIALSDIPRFAQIGVIASIQPTHATSDMPWAEQRLGPDRIQGAYAWRRLVNAGARLAGGSDFPVESHNPLLGFYAAVTRRDLSGKPEGGWRPQEKLTRPEALALFTSGAAYAAFEEDRRGRVAPGFDADLTILASDPMTVPESQIPSITTVLTVTGGRIVYGKGFSSGARP